MFSLSPELCLYTSETWNAPETVIPLSSCRKVLQNLLNTVAPKFARFESSCLQDMGIIATEGVQNTHDWSERTETATASEVGQAGSCRYCGSHSLVASLIDPDQWCVCSTPSLAILFIYRYQLNSNLANLEVTVEVGKHIWDKFWSFCDNSWVARVQ